MKTSGSAASTHYVTVHTPSPQDGVAMALRTTYPVEGDPLPTDMVKLLNRLDRR